MRETRIMGQVRDSSWRLAGRNPRSALLDGTTRPLEHFSGDGVHEFAVWPADQAEGRRLCRWSWIGRAKGGGVGTE